MGSLSKAALLKAPKQRIEKVELPEWGEGKFVWVKPMTAAELVELENIGDDKTERFALHVLAASVCTDTGKKIFDDAAEAADLMNLPIDLVTRMSKAAFQINGLGETKKN